MLIQNSGSRTRVGGLSGSRTRVGSSSSLTRVSGVGSGGSQRPHVTSGLAVGQMFFMSRGTWWFHNLAVPDAPASAGPVDTATRPTLGGSHTHADLGGQD